MTATTSFTPVGSLIVAVLPAITAGSWIAGAALAMDLYSIRYISGGDGERVATVHQPIEMSQEESLANAMAITAVPVLLAALRDIEQALAGHAEFQRGNSKVHYSVHKARSALIKAGQRK